MTTIFEELFNTSVLSVVVPHASLGLPRQSDSLEAWTKWLARLEQEHMDRKLAFFGWCIFLGTLTEVLGVHKRDENLDFLLTVRFPQDDGDSESKDVDPKKPPAHLLAFLAHLQISYDASYVAPIRAPAAPALSPLPAAEVSLDEPVARPPVPPRTHSIPAPGRANHSLNLNLTAAASKHPSIFPPHTPHPVPSAAPSDRQYVQAQGTPLRAGVWGEGPGASTGAEDAFVLLWAEEAREWVAVFRMAVAVSFLPTKVPDPLLCLTASMTLREKPVPATPARQGLAALIEAAGALSPSVDQKSPAGAFGGSGEDSFDLSGMEEVNLFEGLTIGTTFSSDDSEPPLVLPSTRLGAAIRQQAFSLPSLDHAMSSPLQTSSSSPLTSRTSHPTLRKSFRKTLRTVSGFHVRMRTVFVPYFMLPQAGSRNNRRPRTNGAADSSPEADIDEDEDDSELVHERELRETGNDEHTVILCVELENKGESALSFAVESVTVSVGGEGAQTRLIGWGESASAEPQTVFPLHIGPQEQCNLLYVVSFMQSPDTDEFSFARERGLPGAPTVPQLQRAVTIVINGRPCEQVLAEDVSVEATSKTETGDLTYPTRTFPSRWNCVLDLAAQAPGAQAIDSGPAIMGQNDALPTPASPFPTTAVRSGFPRPGSGVIAPPGARPHTPTPGSGANTPSSASAVAGSKRFTLGMLDVSVQSPGPSLKPPPSPMNYRSDTSLLNPTNRRDVLAQSGLHSPGTTTPVGGFSANPIGIGAGQGQARASYTPPSLTVPTYSRTPMTTYGPLSPSAPRIGTSVFGHMQEDSVSSPVGYDMQGAPPTPAYPAFPLTPGPGAGPPHWQGPIASLQSGEVGPPVEIPREKRQSTAGIPPTPGPRVGAGGGFAQMQMQMKGEAALRGAVPADGPREPIVVSVGLLRDTEDERGALGRIHPLDRFTLDVFVFNRSSWTRRFEVSCPDRRSQRRARVAEGAGARGEADDPPGILPLENRVRVGPLLPSTCQSVRMDFIALKPGVHSIEALTLTDVQSGFTMNLRSVMDIVVHEHERSKEP